jgi:hypothetical protein
MKPEKPKKKTKYNSDMIYDTHGIIYNQALDDYDAWLESAIPTEEEIYNVLTDIGFKWKENINKARKPLAENIWILEAKAIHSMIKERIKGC